MSLTSYRAAPPRVNSLALFGGLDRSASRTFWLEPSAKGGNLYRFEEEVKRDIGAGNGPARKPLYGDFP